MVATTSWRECPPVQCVSCAPIGDYIGAADYINPLIPTRNMVGTVPDVRRLCWLNGGVGLQPTP